MDTPKLERAADGTPRSARYDDVYFSREGGLDESRYVFLDHNRLTERFQSMAPSDVFTIVETGFGTGLNFLATWQRFREVAPTDARLVFVSTEQYPLTAEDIAASLDHWPELAPYLKRLTDAYPHRFEGYHSIELDDHVDLLLLLGDANETLADLNARVDAWFLDGFAPSKNPELWKPALFDAMARLSKPGTTAATFTAARVVRDGLAGAGFRVERVKGFGRKRTMVRSQFTGRCGPPPPGLWPRNEWAWPDQTEMNREAIVVGAGLAGAHTAWELARRGWVVRVLEQAPTVAAGASGNTQGAVYARLSHDDAANNRFYAQALELAQRRLKQLPSSVAHQACGLLQLNQGSKEAKRFEHFRKHNPFPDSLVTLVHSAHADDIAGVRLNCDALHFPEGGWVSPSDLVAARLDHPNIQVLTGHQLTHLSRTTSDWRLYCDSDEGAIILHSPTVILATAWETTRLEPGDYLPVRPIAGQVTQTASRGAISGLKTVLCSDRYLVPEHDGQHCLGATFHLKQTDTRIRPEDDAENIQALSARLPGVVDNNAEITGSRAGVRCASPDYLPMVGPLLDLQAFETDYRKPLQKRLTRRLPPPPWQAGLWCNIAHGSKGLCSVPLSAKLLAAWLNGEPMPVPHSLANHLNPNRFAIRSMIRGKR